MTDGYPDPEEDPSLLAEREVWKNSIEYLLDVEEAKINVLNDYVDRNSNNKISAGNFSMNLGELEDMGVVERTGPGTYSITEYGAHLAERANLTSTDRGINTLEAQEPDENLEELLEEDKQKLNKKFEEEGYDEAKREARKKARKYMEIGNPELGEELERYIEEELQD